MTADSMQEKTAVFTFGSLSGDREPRSYDLDEPTRELPLIAGRFAGREWAAEDLRRELASGSALSDKEKRRRRALTLSLGALAAMLLLVMSLLGQARLVGLNERAAVQTETVAELRQEHSRLLAEYEQTRAGRLSESAPAGAARAEMLRAAQNDLPETAAEDRITVLNVRRGRELKHLWNSIVDTLGVSFR